MGKTYWVGIVVVAGDFVHLQFLQKLQFLLAEVQRLARLGVSQASPALGKLNAVQQGIKSLASGGPHDFLAIDIVSNVRVGVIERERNVANGVDRALGIRVVAVVDWIYLCILVAHASIGVLDDSVVGFIVCLAVDVWLVLGIGLAIDSLALFVAASYIILFILVLILVFVLVEFGLFAL